MPATTTNNGAELFDLMVEMPGLILDAEIALDDGIFDGDINARMQAESLIADAKRSYAELWLKAWPETTTPRPTAEVHS